LTLHKISENSANCVSSGDAMTYHITAKKHIYKGNPTVDRVVICK